MADSRIKFDLFNTYIARIKNSIDSKIFQNVYVIENGKKRDAASSGRFACAQFISGILFISKLIKDMHTTTQMLLKDMEDSNWYKIDKPREGAVIIWAPWKTKEDLSKNIISFPWENEDRWHAGFYIGNDKVISNDPNTRAPKEHHLTYGEKNGKPIRKIEGIWWNDKLN